jgi:synaptic vesicle membrane protein VAT-1
LRIAGNAGGRSKNLFFWSGKRTTFFGLRRSSKNFMLDLELLFEWLKSGKISVPVKATFRLEEIQKAHREYASSSRMAPL